MLKSKIIGTFIGPYFVIETVSVPIPSGRMVTKYRVQCQKCGTIEIKQKNQLDRIKSDGCMNCSSPKFTPKLTLSQRNFNNYKKKIEARHYKSKKSIKFNLSFEEFDKLTHSNCYYCGDIPSFPKRFKNEFKNREIENLNGIDRINSDKDYVIENCVPCCAMCNRMKSDFNIIDFFNHVEKINIFRNVQRLSKDRVI